MISRVGEWICAPDVATEIWRAYERYATAEEAIEAGRRALGKLKENREWWDAEDVLGDMYDDYEDIPDTFAIGQTFSPSIYLDGIQTIEWLQEQVYEECGEAGETFLDYVSKEAITDLEDSLNRALQQWLDKHNLQPTCYSISNVREIKLEEEAE